MMGESLSEGAQTLLGVMSSPVEESEAIPAATPVEEPETTGVNTGHEDGLLNTVPPAVEESGESDWDTLVEKSGLTRKQLYAIKLPAATGQEAITLGAAVDAVESVNELAANKAAQTSALQDKENQVLQTLRDAQSLLDMLPENARSPEMVERLRAQQADYLHRERGFLLQALPDWSNPATATAEQQGIADLMRGYGYSDSEIGAIADHRTVKILRDFAQLKALVSDIPAKEKREGKAQTKRRTGTQTEGLKQIAADEKAGKITRREAATLTLLHGMKK